MGTARTTKMITVGRIVEKFFEIFWFVQSIINEALKIWKREACSFEDLELHLRELRVIRLPL